MPEKRFGLQLAQQLTFIENSWAAFDKGQQLEAIRIGTSLRVLLHDTARSTSLLTHLGSKDTPLLSTYPVQNDIPDGRIFDGLVRFTMGSTGILIRPKLGQASTLIQVPAKIWWEQLVIGLGHGRNLSRAVIALTAANKDGGAHVDDDLPEDYSALVEGVWIVSSNRGQGLVPDHHLMYLRQMGYEILNSPSLLALAA